MLIERSCCTSDILKVLRIAVRRNVDMGGVGSIPANAMIGHMLARCGDGAVFNSL